jgi:bifunctional UDP-N-acetylglucosamine pyrophosphorylase/glucosamine-1-phosphate N-acetyltransferase
MSVNVIVMAAGKGTRMRSARPKVLHRLAGAPLLQHVLRAAAAVSPDAPSRTIVITGHGAEEVEAAVAAHAPGAVCMRQMPQLGTGHAVQQAVPALDRRHETTLVLNGDAPLVRAQTAAGLVQACGGSRLALLTIELPDPTGYGRILREGEGVVGIVEQRDASPAQQALREVYTGMMAAPTDLLARWVMALGHDNAQGEYYLTDVVTMAVAEGVPVVAVPAADEDEVMGVNSPQQLADVERRYQQQQAVALMEAGVRLADPARLDVRGTLQCGQDVEIDIGCLFEGEVTLGNGVQVGAHCVIRDARIEAGTVIHPFTHIEGAHIGPDARVGPFARLRPGAELGAEVHIGNFVEVKNSTLGPGAKANHLAYLGDATVGARVNYGAGSITANYDGANKHRTTIGDDAHVGSNCVLVAPVEVGAGATIGGGSTLSRNAPAGQLTVARAKAVTVPGWKRPRKAAGTPKAG